MEILINGFFYWVRYIIIVFYFILWISHMNYYFVYTIIKKIRNDCYDII